MCKGNKERNGKGDLEILLELKGIIAKELAQYMNVYRKNTNERMLDLEEKSRELEDMLISKVKERFGDK